MEGAISRIAVVLGWLFDDTSEGVRRGGGGGEGGYVGQSNHLHFSKNSVMRRWDGFR